MKYRTIFFRCSETGKRFGIVFGQYSPSHRFQIVRILDNEEEMIESLEMFENNSDYPKLKKSTVYEIENIDYNNSARESQNSNQVRKIFNQSETFASFNSEEFDFSGWFCPHCGHSKGEKSVWPPFVNCNKCNELVCGARVQKVNEALLFACYDGCGGSGRLEGEITSYIGMGIDSQEKKLLPDNSKQLPSPANRLALKPPDNN